MRAAIFSAPRDIRIESVATKEPEAGEVRVRIEGCGLCASNLAVWEGRPWFDYPLEPGAPGHEAWGRIDKAGEGVENFKEGDRVALISGRCFAEYENAASESVVSLPSSLDGEPFPGEPLACAMNIFARSDIQAGQVVTIVGIGFLGALLTALAKGKGAQVFALSRRPTALERAREYGADEVVSSVDPQKAVERVADLTNDRGCDVVIEATGRQIPLEMAGELTRIRGRLVIAGYHQDGTRQVNMQMWNWKGLDVINAHERDPSAYVRGMKAAIEAVENGVLDPAPLYTHRYPLERLATAFQAHESRIEGFMKALVEI